MVQPLAFSTVVTRGDTFVLQVRLAHDISLQRAASSAAEAAAYSKAAAAKAAGTAAAAAAGVPAATTLQQIAERHEPAAAVLLGFPVMVDVPGVAGVHHFAGESFACACYRQVGNCLAAG